MSCCIDRYAKIQRGNECRFDMKVEVPNPSGLPVFGDSVV